MASISRRAWIQWDPDEPSEPTDTLVLTSPGRHFVDVRILKDSPNASHPPGIRPLSQLDWAFGGTSSSTLIGSPSSPSGAITKSTWKHFVDSRHVDAEAVVDEGEMEPMENDRMLERGRMVNPATGRMTAYVECWEDVEVGGGKEVVVLRMREDGHGERGMVVRVGQFCQGVVRSGEGFAVERWGWEEGEGKGWRRIVRMGDLWMPCGVAMESGMLERGGKVRYKEQEWEVVELI